ncbi:MAG: 3-keto-disaccharide hydrolase [Planctomycetota bacterium]
MIRAAEPAGEEAWTPLFNGKDLAGWKVKIKGHDLGDNYKNTFRVEDGLLKVAYDGYDKFDGKFGHLFYHEPFSSYVLRVEYRFVGEQCPGGPGWAFRNSGIMIHGQSPESMEKEQNFPVSIEVQLLGGSGRGTRPTGNVCTPGTHIVMDDKLVTRSQRAKKAPGKAASQGGGGHLTFPGAIGWLATASPIGARSRRVAQWPPVFARSAPPGLRAGGKTLRGSQARARGAAQVQTLRADKLRGARDSRPSLGSRPFVA